MAGREIEKSHGMEGGDDLEETAFRERTRVKRRNLSVAVWFVRIGNKVVVALWPGDGGY
jgi:hypothetical protein